MARRDKNDEPRGVMISIVAEKFSIHPQTLRMYEREGLIAPPARSEGNYRLYRAGDAERLAFIRHCRALDMALPEIRGVITANVVEEVLLQQLSPEEGVRKLKAEADEAIRNATM